MDEEEALEAIAGGADIIDVKNPLEGPLGASFPWIIRKIAKAAPPYIEVSCTLGDLPNLPGTAALSALGAASLGVNYVKVGLCQLKTMGQAVEIMRSVVKAVRECDTAIKVVVAGYADAERVGSINPLLIPQIANTAECDIAMIDTAVKDGKTLLDFLTLEQLRKFVDEAHGCSLQAALAGSLRKNDLPALSTVGVDIIGLRGAACTGSDRVNGRITQGNVRILAQIIRNAQSRNALTV